MAKIVLVEDSPDTKDLVKAILEMFHHTVEIAETGEEGLEKILNVLPDVVLIDISLPGRMSGLDVVRELRGNTTFDKTPILAVTAHALMDDRRKSLEAGCDEHITKPIVDLQEFAHIVSRYAAQGRNTKTES